MLPWNHNNSQTTIHSILELYQICRRNGDWANIRKPNHFDIFSSQNPNCDQKLKNLWSLVTIFRHAAEKQLTKSHLFEVKWSEVYWITARNLNALLQSEGVGLAHQATQFKLQISPFPCPWISYLFNWAHSQSGNSNPFLWGRNDNTSQSIPVQIYRKFFFYFYRRCLFLSLRPRFTRCYPIRD